MPVTFRIPRKSIKINKDNRIIIDIYKDAMKTSGIPGADRDGAGGVGAERLRDGFWPRYVLSTWEKLTGESANAKALDLEGEGLQLDPPAEILLTHYIDYLNHLLQEEQVVPARTEADQLTDKFAITRELLIRLVGVALSNNLDLSHDGDSLISVLEHFVEQLAAKEVLFRKDVLQRKRVSKFQSKFSSTHDQWIGRVREMVDVVKSINANRKAVSDTLDNLNVARRKLQGQLVAFMSGKGTVADSLSPTWSHTTWSDVQRQCMEALSHEGHDASLVHGDGLMTEAMLTAYVEKKIQKGALAAQALPKVKCLYGLLVDTDRLYEVFSQIDLLITCTSWVPILFGVFRFDGLVTWLDEYGAQVEHAMDLSGDEFRDILKIKEVIRQGMASGAKSRYNISLSSAELRSLDDEGLRRRIAGIIHFALSSLVNVQGSLPEKYRFIDERKLKVLQLRREPLSLVDAGDSALPPEDDVVSAEGKDAKIAELTAALESMRLALDERSEELRLLQAELPAQAGEATKQMHDFLVRRNLSESMLTSLLAKGACLATHCKLEGPFYGCPALHMAAATGSVALCKQMLDQSPEILSISSGGKTALDIAYQFECGPIIAYLSERGGMRFADMQTQALHRLIEDPQVTSDDESVSPAMLRTLDGLLRRGADINGVNQSTNAWRGNRPLHTLLVKGNQRLIHWAMSKGADPALARLSTSREPETPWQYFYRTAQAKQPRLESFLRSCVYGHRFFDEAAAQAGADGKAAPTLTGRVSCVI